MIAKPRFHCWRDTQGLVNSAEIVMHVMESNRVLQILKFLAESVSQSRESAHRHSHGQILSLDVAGRNMFAGGTSDNSGLASAYAYCGTVSDLGVSSGAVYLLELCIVNVATKGFSDTPQISNVTIRCELHPVSQAAFEVTHEVVGVGGRAPTYHPTGNELCIRVNGNPSPYIASAFGLLFFAAILVLRVNKAPNLITLDALEREIAKSLVLVFGASAAKVTQQLHDRCAMEASHSGNRSQRVALDQGGNDLLPLIDAQSVHANTMLDRSSIVNNKCENFVKNFKLDRLSAVYLNGTEKLEATGFEPATGRSRVCPVCRLAYAPTNDEIRNKCGAGGIPTRGTCQRPSDYKSATLEHSVTAPICSVLKKSPVAVIPPGFCEYRSTTSNRVSILCGHTRCSKRGTYGKLLNVTFFAFVRLAIYPFCIVSASCATGIWQLFGLSVCAFQALGPRLWPSHPLTRRACQGLRQRGSFEGLRSFPRSLWQLSDLCPLS